MVREFTKGVLTTLVFLFLFGIVFAVGFHTASEITSGTFVGTFDFSGATVTGLSNGPVQLDSIQVCNSTNKGKLKYNTSQDKFFGCNGADWREIELGNLEIVLGDSLDKLLLHCENFEDSSINSQAVTLVGSPIISTGYFSNACSFDTSGDYISIADSTDWDFGTEDFTIDFWVYPTNPNLNSVQNGIISFPTNDGTNRKIVIYSDQVGIYFGATYGAWRGPSLLKDVWTHIAIVRNGNNFKVYFNGVEGILQAGDSTYSGNFDNSADNKPLLIASSYDATATSVIESFIGKIDELRISKGVVRWTSDFPVPTSPYE